MEMFDPILESHAATLHVYEENGPSDKEQEQEDVSQEEEYREQETVTQEDCPTGISDEQHTISTLSVLTPTTLLVLFIHYYTWQNEFL